MPSSQLTRSAPKEYMQWKKNHYSQMPFRLVEFFVKVGLGRNGWAVAARLCRCIHSDGSLGKVSRKTMMADTGLSMYQVDRGMKELRQKLVIEPIPKFLSGGYPTPDRSNRGHVAQYRLTEDVLDYIREEISGIAPYR